MNNFYKNSDVVGNPIDFYKLREYIKNLQYYLNLFYLYKIKWAVFLAI